MKTANHAHAAPSPKKATRGAPATIAKPRKSKVGDADASPDKSEAVDPEAVGPSAMDLLNIACMFELIPPPAPPDIRGENMMAKMDGLAELEKDEQFCSHLKEAARLYRLAEAVAHKTRQADPKPDTKVIRRNLLRIWEYAILDRKKYLPLDEAMKALRFRTEDSFRQFMRTFFCSVCGSDIISVDAIRILKILRAEQSRKEDAKRKRKQRASISKNNAQSAAPQQEPKVDPDSPLQEAKVDPDIVYTDLLKSLEMAFQQAGVQVDASLFFPISLSDILDKS